MRNLLVLWDVDHTLINAGGLGWHIYELVFRDIFGRDLPGMAFVDGRTERAIITDTLAGAGIAEPGRHVDDFLAAMAKRAPTLDDVAKERIRLLPGAAAALAALAALVKAPGGPHSGVAAVQSVLTGNMRSLAELKLRAPGLARYLDLDVGAFGDQHEVRSELVHIARRNASRVYGHAFAGQQTVLVGDTPLDVAAALATGARAVGVATGRSTAGELAAAGAHAALPGLTDTAEVVSAILG